MKQSCIFLILDEVDEILHDHGLSFSSTYYLFILFFFSKRQYYDFRCLLEFILGIIVDEEITFQFLNFYSGWNYNVDEK